MFNRFEYVILSDKSLILEYYNGDFQGNELIELKKKVSRDKCYNPNFNIIHDFRDAEFLFEDVEMLKYIKHIFDNSNMFGIRKSTMITRNPNQVVASALFDIHKKDLPISIKICSTFECAFMFVGLAINDWESVESLFNELKSAP